MGNLPFLDMVGTMVGLGVDDEDEVAPIAAMCVLRSSARAVAASIKLLLSSGFRLSGLICFLILCFDQMD